MRDVLSFGLVDVNWEVSIGTLIGTLVGVFVGVGVRRFFEKMDDRERKAEHRKQFALDLVERFNSKEVLAAREQAENLLLERTGEKLQDIRDDDRISCVWLVSREYEFLSLALEEDLIERDLSIKYFFEIFIYWNQHFRLGLAGEDFELVKRLRYLDETFKTHEYTGPQYAAMDAKQQKHLNRLRANRQLPPFDFSRKPEYPIQEDRPAARAESAMPQRTYTFPGRPTGPLA